MTNAVKHHFFMASYCTWITTGKTYTFSDALRLMNKEKRPYYIWYVPLAPDETYDIEFYVPKVPNAHIVDFVKSGKTYKEKL